METYKAAAVQMNSQPNIEHNLNQARALVQKAAKAKTRLVCLPENFAFLGDFDLRMQKADEIHTKAESFLKDIAAKYGIYLIGGSFPAPAGNDKVYNRSLLINPEGRTVAKYDKMHLFDVDLDDGESYRESDFVEPGDSKPILWKSDEIGNIGLSVCYDLRFPELYRELAAKGAEILTVPSAFTQTTGEVHWETLLRARAIENTSYVLAPAQTGVHGPNRKTYGHSLIVDPWGEVLADGKEEIGFVTADISPNRLKKVRESIPSLNHRRI
ncbi:MAG: carbon-nitrogen hydrolase family protein [Balneolaceae bacterium]|nr:carbon-nitrogen hydrolase family protein [Balneolaceae bacterium]